MENKNTQETINRETLTNTQETYTFKRAHTTDKTNIQNINSKRKENKIT